MPSYWQKLQSSYSFVKLEQSYGTAIETPLRSWFLDCSWCPQGCAEFFDVIGDGLWLKLYTYVYIYILSYISRNVQFLKVCKLTLCSTLRLRVYPENSSNKQGCSCFARFRGFLAFVKRLVYMYSRRTKLKEHHRKPDVWWCTFWLLINYPNVSTPWSIPWNSQNSFWQLLET